jgi:hypothetical protein
MPDPVSGRVFISYRRQEIAPYARLLYERLAGRLSDDQVFMDVDTIAPGLDFAEVITEAVSTCEVLLAVIGPRWLAPRTRTASHGWRTPATSSGWRSRPPWNATSGSSRSWSRGPRCLAASSSPRT